MRIKYLAQGENILMLGFEPSTYNATMRYQEVEAEECLPATGDALLTVVAGIRVLRRVFEHRQHDLYGPFTCPYIQSLFNCGLKASISDTLTLDCGVAYAMTKEIKLIYTGDPSASVHDILDVLEGADYLQLEVMIDICLWQWQVTNAILKNCVKILLLVIQHSLPIYDTVLHFVYGHLPELLPGDDYIQLSKCSLLDLESVQPLSYVKGEDFLRFIFRWVKHNERQRTESTESAE